MSICLVLLQNFDITVLQLSVRDAELAGVTEQRDTARSDLEETHLARDEVVRKAWEVRDAAVARKNTVEVELAKTRIDVMQANSQLMEAIQQKVELSQQLEQWQVSYLWCLQQHCQRLKSSILINRHKLNSALSEIIEQLAQLSSAFMYDLLLTWFSSFFFYGTRSFITIFKTALHKSQAIILMNLIHFIKYLSLWAILLLFILSSVTWVS